MFLFANQASSTLAAPAGSSATSLTLAAGSGSKFPSPSGIDVFALVLADAATNTSFEVVYCTARTGDVLTVLRAQEGTTALNWTTGDFANLFVTKGQMEALAQSLGGTTAQRPAAPKLYQSYFDATLGVPITCSQVTPSIVWVNAAGVAV